MDHKTTVPPMQVPMEIAFHNVARSDWAEDAIRNHVARLEEIYERLITCRVRVDQRADNSNHTIPPVVRIEMSVPGHDDLVVAHEPDHLQRKFQSPGLHNAINEAFVSPSAGWPSSRTGGPITPRRLVMRQATNSSARSPS